MFNIFSECSGLTNIQVEEGNSKYDSREGCNAIIETTSNTLVNGCKNTVIPNSVTSIGNYAFLGCSGLTSLTIPNSVTSIKNGTFEYCEKLENVYCYAVDIPAMGNSVFNDSSISSATLHVPASSVEEYRTTAPWNGFANIVPLTDDELKSSNAPNLIAEDSGKPIKIYTIDGKSLPKVQRGLNILRMNNGNVKKVIVK